MLTAITGIVTNGVIVPSSPLPEGTCVEIHLSPMIPADLQEELTAWQQGSAEALALVEKLAEEDQGHENR